MTKCCVRCGNYYPLSFYNKDKQKKDGLRPECKSCQKVWRSKNREKLAERAKNWYTKNKEYVLDQKRTYYTQNKETLLAKRKSYYLNNKTRILSYLKTWRENNREYTRNLSRNYGRKHRKARNLYHLNKRRQDPQFDVACRLRIRMANKLRSKKPQGMEELLGCSWKQLIEHLESQFKPGMTWDNRNEWHIDHIRPLASFDLTDENQLREACHYTNLQPLWARDNLKKGAKLLVD